MDRYTNVFVWSRKIMDQRFFDMLFGMEKLYLFLVSKEGSIKFYAIDPWAIRSIIDSNKNGLCGA